MTKPEASHEDQTLQSPADEDASQSEFDVDLLCFSHLRWHFVTQRPQHLLNRCARHRRVFFWEEPYFDADDRGDGTPTLESMQEGPTLTVLRPHLPRAGDAETMQAALLDAFLAEHQVDSFVSWYYTPMALGFSAHLSPEATVYDCMDELSAFIGAPPALVRREEQLLEIADVVFTGGMSLYEAKRKRHQNVHAFPSSIDMQHFAQAAGPIDDPSDQASLPHPRAGFFGVLDERFDIELVKEIAHSLPEVQFLFLGPVVKIDPGCLPRSSNIHYLGAKSYAELPRYLGNWDVALLPFALNESTRFISPTKTPEYLAAGKPVVSTPIADVVSGYGRDGLVTIAKTPAEFAAAIRKALQPATPGWIEAVKRKLGSSSWDQTWNAMWHEVERSLEPRGRRSASTKLGTISHLRALSVHTRVAPRKREHYDFLVVGAGLAGAVVAERLANGMGKRVLIIDKRPHIAGNTYDYHDAAGILVHKYGPHIFHTNSTEVVEYLSHFTSWRNFEHRVLASVDGKLLPIPINLDTINSLYGLQLDAESMRQYLSDRCIQPALIRTSEDIVVSRIGRDLYEKFFRNYTRKQWGLDPSELDASVAGRIPVRFNRDDRYFSDSFQAMPADGYTRMFERMLDSPNITIRTGVEYGDVARAYRGVRTIYTGPIDEFFDYVYGPLPYRSLQFRHETHDIEHFQSAPVVNYPNEHAYTRITEFKYLTGQKAARTSIVYEFPTAEGDPYYPIPRPENAALYARYKELADRRSDVSFVGRLATYRYYNMDQVVGQALVLAHSLAAQSQAIALPTLRPSSLVEIAT